MSSGYGRASGGGNGPTTNRKRNNKKFGLNLSQLTKPPAAPPVPSIIATGQSSSGGTSKSPANGLLLLSKKSQSSGGGLLAPAAGGAVPGASVSSKQTAHDALLLSAQGGAAAVDGQSGGEDNGGGKATAWGIAAEKQQSELKPQTSVESIMGELTLEATGQTSIQPRGEVESISVKNDEKSSTLVLAPRGSLAKQRSTVSALSDSASAPKNNADDMKAAPTEEKATDAPRKNEQQQLMSKLAKDRAQQLKSEEDARISHQNERAAKRLKELELKRLEQKKERERQHQQKLQRHQKKQQRFEGPPSSIVIGKDTPSMKRSPTITSPNVPSKIYSRKEVSQPSIVLEPLGKPKTIMTHSDKPHTNKNEIIDPQNDGKKKLYDPKRPFSSLVGGKPKHNPETLAGCGSVKSNKSEESSAAKDSRSSVGKASPALKSYNNNDESPPTSVRMVNLNSFEDRYRGVGRGPSSGSGPRMLFDPTSGSLVAAPSGDSSQQHHHQQQHTSLPGAKGNIKKTKPAQQQLSQKTVSGTGKHVDNSTKFSSRRQEGDPAKQKQVLQHKKEKNITGNSRSPPKSTRMKFPRTCGVLFRMDERGNYVNADECEADCGYGQHSVPGGRVKNHDAYAKLIEQNQQSTQGNSPQKASNKLNADAPSFMGFRKDPNFIQQQTDFEAQQQRILEDAWLSLVEAEPSREEEQNEEVPLPSQSHSDKDICNGGDEYAAALAISPTMFGLGFDKEEPIDISKFALEGDAIGLMPTNRFSSLGTGGSRLLGSSTWGVGNTTPPADTTLSGLAGISGWNFESSNTNETEPSKASNTFINLNGWGSSGLDSFAFGGSYKDSSKGSG